MKKFLFVFLFIVCAGCTQSDKLYRDNQAQECQDNLLFLGSQRKKDSERLLVGMPAQTQPIDNSTAARGNSPATLAHCYFQQHAGSKPPRSLKATPQNPDHRFNLSFVEFPDHADDSIRTKQTDRLIQSLRENSAMGRANYVVVYVHGWRHDADINNEDVRTFRTILNYTRSFLDQRPEYKDAVLTGVYVGWRGRSFTEPFSGKGERLLNTAFAIPTFWSRKKASERVAPKVFDLIKELNGIVVDAPSNDRQSRLLVMGHSLGGNLVAEAVKEPLLEAIEEDHIPGTELVLPFADLILLINPAAESSKMNVIQKAIRSKVGLGDENPVDYQTSEQRNAFESLFPVSQPPRYISITTSCDWGFEKQDKPRVDCDQVTGWIFSAAMRVQLKFGENAKAIGHHVADYRLHTPSEKERKDGTASRRVRGPEFGASHDLVINRGIDKETSFSSAENTQLNACPRLTERWLSLARQRAGDFGRGWDTSYNNGLRSPLLHWPKGNNKGAASIEVQFRHGLDLPPRRSDKLVAGKDVYIDGLVRSVAPANSPVWNVRSYDNVISNHDGFTSYVLWCVLSQIMLDEI